jgi:hypothetical protein
MKIAPELLAHREWIGQIGQVGLVVAPSVLVDRGVFIDQRRAVQAQQQLASLVERPDDGEPMVKDAAMFFRDVLEWNLSRVAGTADGPPVPDALTIALPNYEDYLRPDWAVPDDERQGEWLLLVQFVAHGTDFDRVAAEDQRGWRASPLARLERLLRETGVPIGLLWNGTSLRLVYAPRGESSGHLTFRFRYLIETQGRPMAGALCALLSEERLLERPDKSTLALVLRESRRAQNDVSTELAGQVLEALWHLVRGFQHANEVSKGQLLDETLREEPQEVYGGLLATLMRLVFILYAEERDGVMPASDVYQQHYSVSGLFQRLRENEALYPDTMDSRYGAWAQLLALFRLIHDGGRHGDMHFVARHGRLFNPDAYPFLEGRPRESTRVLGTPIEAPRVSDGVVYRVLSNLLILDGERLSYRALDVEQIGSVYEAMMGFALDQAKGPSVAVSPKHIVFDIEELLETKGSDRAKWLGDKTELKLKSPALAKAQTVDEVLAALEKKVSRYTPRVLSVGSLYLQPTEERRRSGSHYTPRTLTAPIVRTTFRPIFERLGEKATPEQILDLKVCDLAMGSGAFLVEACRLLGDRLVKAWEDHRRLPDVPVDEDPWTYARRLVAERCLYGVDRNVFAVDLAKLSLWLATLAREHPFTFLDHALRHGDSLVGLTREQIACFKWETGKQLPMIRAFLAGRTAEAQRLREEIQALATSDDVRRKAELLRESSEALDEVRLVGDAVVSAFFSGEKPKERKAALQALSTEVMAWMTTVASDPAGPLPGQVIAAAEGLREHEHPIPPFHWEVEFPEVFTRDNGGFDVFVGNPPFAGKNTLSAANRAGYPVWLKTLHEESHGNADVVAHFYRRAFNLLRNGGTFGLIATNTIAQGDTRGTGLRWIRHHGGTIFAARKRVKWPGEAAVVVSVVHVHKGELGGAFDLDGRRVDKITAFLFHTGGDDDPATLPENAGKSFIGSYVLGMGFTFDDTDKEGVASPIALMEELIKKDPRNADRIFPYIGGEEVNSSPTHAHHRYVINFEQMTEEEAKRWPDLMAIVEARVKGTRASHSTADWWHFERYRPELYTAIRGLERVLVTPQTSNAQGFALVSTGQVYSHTLVVFASGSVSLFAVMQSRLHQEWAAFLGPTMKDDLRYAPSDCFETFPFSIGWDADRGLGAAGREYYDFRAMLMVTNKQGLTETYNRFHDPEETDAGILRLRELHDAMDRVVLDAYHWTDIQPTCEFLLDFEDDDEADASAKRGRKKPYRYRWPDDVRDEVLGRLLALNAERAETRAVERNASERRPKHSKPMSLDFSEDDA